jgi:hypothetical protein
MCKKISRSSPSLSVLLFGFYNVWFPTGRNQFGLANSSSPITINY